MNHQELVECTAYPRAGLIGNPSDGYNGRTIAFTFRNFAAHVKLIETPKLRILPDRLDGSDFDSMQDLCDNVKSYGYYGGVRLLKASLKKFYEHCLAEDLKIADRNFTIKYASTIPHRVGLAGSSAIITACFKALMRFYDVSIPPPILANKIREVETQELRLPAGLQDRGGPGLPGTGLHGFRQGVDAFAGLREL